MWTVPSTPLPSPALPSPPLPSPPLPPLPSLPPSRVPNLIKLGPAVWPKRASVAPPWRSVSGHFDQAGSSRLAEARECGAALAISEWKRRQSAMIVRMHSETVFFLIRELWFESGLMNGPVQDLKGKWSECHRVRNAKRPRKGSNSRTVPYYYIDNLCSPSGVIYKFKFNKM